MNLNDLPQLMRSARERHGLTQQQIADSLQVTRAAVGQWERGTTTPTHENLIRLLAILNRTEAIGAKDVEEVSSLSPATLRWLIPRPAAVSGGVPVKFCALGSIGGVISFDKQLNESVFRPRILHDDETAYAVAIVTDKLAPRFEMGETLYVSQKEPPTAGDYALYWPHVTYSDKDPIGWVAKVNALIQTTWQLFDVASGGMIVAKGEELHAIHRILPWNELISLPA